jgi:hypothetical protein
MIRWVPWYDGGESYPYSPATSPPARDYLPLEPNRGEVLPSTGVGTQDRIEVKTDLHVEPPHHVQKLDETHCKALSFLQSENAVKVSKVRRRTSIGKHDLWIMEVGHDREGKSRYKARGGREDPGDGGENDEEGDIESANIEGYINACAIDSLGVM